MRLALCLGIVGMLGCQPPPLTEKEYTDRFLASMTKFHAAARADTARPIPPMTELTGLKRRKFMVEHTKAGARLYEPLAQEFRLLRPPDRWKQHKAVMQRLLDTFIADIYSWAEAIEQGKRKSIDSKGADIDSHLVENFRALVGESERLGVPAHGLREQLQQLERATDGQ